MAGKDVTLLPSNRQFLEYMLDFVGRSHKFQVTVCAMVLLKNMYIMQRYAKMCIKSLHKFLLLCHLID